MKNILLLLALSVNMAQAQYSLSLNLQKGNTYSLALNSDNHFNGEMNGQKIAMTTAMTGIMKFKVLSVSDTGYQLEASYDTLHFAVKSPMGNMEFSSGNSTDDNLANGPMNMMGNKHFEITILKNGAVSDIKSPDTTEFSTMMKNFPMIQGMKQMMMMGPMKHSFSKEAMKENMEKMTAVFPNKKVKLNETWSSVIQPDSNMDHSLKTTYQLISYADGIAIIKGHTETKASGGHKQANGFGMMLPLTYNLEGESFSTIQINTNTGWIKQAEIKNELKGNVQMKNKDNKETKNDPIQMEGMLTISGN